MGCYDCMTHESLPAQCVLSVGYTVFCGYCVDPTQNHEFESKRREEELAKYLMDHGKISLDV